MARSALSQGFDSQNKPGTQGFFQSVHIDWPLMTGIIALSLTGLVVLYSASGEDWSTMIRQIIWLCIALTVMVVTAQIPPHHLEFWAPWVFGVGLMFLVMVLLFGDVGKGAQRWLNFGLFRFQPSEMMEL